MKAVLSLCTSALRLSTIISLFFLRLRFPVTVALLCLSLSWGSHAQTALKPPLPDQIPSGCKKVVVGAHPDYRPFHYTENNRLVGLSIDLAKRLEKDLNIPFEIHSPTPWKRVLAEANTGDIDMLIGLKDTRERRKFLNYSYVPVFANPSNVFVLTPLSSKVKTWLDLISLRGAISAGDKFGDEFDEFSTIFLNLAQAQNAESLMKMLLHNRVDYVVVGRATGYSALALINDDSSGVVESIIINNGLIYLALSKRSPCAPLMSVINGLLLNYLKEQR
ncbi:substrate-binding periplasmic protein [Marinibactrum halimedae]|uniref:substrate-binding periplasmic protein n=1 Tax=Marinibactrum halimedae TaxID=1444977 RepID=UPI001E5016AA|nr:transporter substrate-binding domain-containing protein [Marinibactrum halimedae]